MNGRNYFREVKKLTTLKKKMDATLSGIKHSSILWSP